MYHFNSTFKKLLEMAYNKCMSAASCDQMVRVAWCCTERVSEKETEAERILSSVINVWHGHRIGKW